MSEKKKKIATLYTPKGIAVYPRLNKPDYKFSPEGKFSLKLKLTKEEAEKLLEPLKVIAEEGFAEAVEKTKGKKDKKGKPINPVNEGLPFQIELDKETGQETGFVLIPFGMKAQFKDSVTQEIKTLRPTIVDSKGNDCRNVEIGGGSILKVAFKPSHYYNDATQKSGVTFYLVGVQICKLVKFGGNLDFGNEEDGYEVDEADMSASPSEEVGGQDGVQPSSASLF